MKNRVLRGKCFPSSPRPQASFASPRTSSLRRTAGLRRRRGHFPPPSGTAAGSANASSPRPRLSLEGSQADPRASCQPTPPAGSHEAWLERGWSKGFVEYGQGCDGDRRQRREGQARGPRVECCCGVPGLHLERDGEDCRASQRRPSRSERLQLVQARARARPVRPGSRGAGRLAGEKISSGSQLRAGEGYSDGMTCDEWIIARKLKTGTKTSEQGQQGGRIRGLVDRRDG